MKVRTRFLITVSLLLLALSGTAIAARATVGAFQQFQEEQTLTAKNDVQMVHAWMTIPYIAHNYHVPTSYLYKALKIAKEDHVAQHSTLNEFAMHTRQSVTTIIHTVQVAILNYRKQHPTPPAHPRRAKSLTPPAKPTQFTQPASKRTPTPTIHSKQNTQSTITTGNTNNKHTIQNTPDKQMIHLTPSPTPKSPGKAHTQGRVAG